ncbi:MAG TPA: ankyrin repeat domain-containing protein [Gemmatimonadaceae bacterium]|jgi:peptide-methionine (S)-S-oxide reductase
MSASGRDPDSFDADFRAAVSAIDSGDAAALDRLVRASPSLVRDRLESSPVWLRDQVGKALDGFFRRPYLLWFVAEDPVRNGALSANIADIARIIIDAARRESSSNLQEQLDYALKLVSWSWIARQSGVQNALIDVLVDAGANPGGAPNDALVNGNIDAAEHLVRRGAPITLPAALILGRWDDADRLLASANEEQRQFTVVLSALNGRAAALRHMIQAGADVNARSAHLYSHGTPLHHAVSSGSLEAVQVLVEAGADLAAKDSAWGGTPLGWAEHYIGQRRGGASSEPPRASQYSEIVNYLRTR